MTFAESFIQDFRCDFVLSTGEIVDDPDSRWSRLTILYKEALKEREREKSLKDEINSIIALDGDDYTDGEIIDMIANLTGYVRCE